MRLADELDELMNRLMSRIGKDDKEEGEEDEFIRRHCQNAMQYFIVKTVVKHFLDRAIRELPPEKLRMLADSRMVVSEKIFNHPRFGRIARWVASVGRKIVRKDWGDEKTERVLFLYFRKFRPELNVLTDGELRSWIRRELDWIRRNVLDASELEEELVEELENVLHDGGGA